MRQSFCPGLGVCCVAGCDQLAVDSFLKQARCGEVIIQEGGLSISGWDDRQSVSRGAITGCLARFWFAADDFRLV